MRKGESEAAMAEEQKGLRRGSTVGGLRRGSTLTGHKLNSSKSMTESSILNASMDSERSSGFGEGDSISQSARSRLVYLASS